MIHQAPAIRVLVMLGGIPLHGQERGNIQVFTALQGQGVEPLFVTHKGYGHESIQPLLDRLGLPWTTGTYPGLISRGMVPREWAARAREVAAANRDFWQAGRAFGPTHIHVCNEGHFLLLLPAVRALGVPVVFRLGDEPRQHRPIFRALWRRAIVPSVDQFVCISGFVREKLIAAGADPSKIRVIHNAPPVRPEEMVAGGSAGSTGGDDALATVAAEPFGGRTVVYVGQLNENKGVHLLVEAALRLCQEQSDLRVLIAGDYEWRNPFAKGLMRRVERAGLTDRIRFIGYVNDVPGLLALADVHCAPSVWQEALGNVVVEAKQAGTPSVVFDTGGLPELVLKDGHDGLVCAEKSADALEAGLCHYLDMDEVQLTAAKRAAADSLGRLGITREAFTKAWLDVYSGAPSVPDPADAANQDALPGVLAP